MLSVVMLNVVMLSVVIGEFRQIGVDVAKLNFGGIFLHRAERQKVK
jgi:hypothetical protein